MKDLSNKKIGKLLVLRRADIYNKYGHTYWHCICDCGKEKIVGSNGLMQGTKSCGCIIVDRISKLNYIHGLYKSNIHHIWASMIQRCRDKNHSGYKNYGGRGITVCDRWKNLNNFIEDMGHRPEGKSIDRINPNGNYEPSNCRWATMKEQQNNRTNTRILEYKGYKDTVSGWAEKTGIKRTLIWSRIGHGWKDHEAIQGHRDLRSERS